MDDTAPVRLVGGPGAGDTGRVYVGRRAREIPAILLRRGGTYRFSRRDRDGTLLYVFEERARAG
jgi:hypothetical protein